MLYECKAILFCSFFLILSQLKKKKNQKIKIKIRMCDKQLVIFKGKTSSQSYVLEGCLRRFGAVVKIEKGDNGRQWLNKLSMQHFTLSLCVFPILKGFSFVISANSIFCFLCYEFLLIALSPNY